MNLMQFGIGLMFGLAIGHVKGYEAATNDFRKRTKDLLAFMEKRSESFEKKLKEKIDMEV